MDKDRIYQSILDYIQGYLNPCIEAKNPQIYYKSFFSREINLSPRDVMYLLAYLVKKYEFLFDKEIFEIPDTFTIHGLGEYICTIQHR